MPRRACEQHLAVGAACGQHLLSAVRRQQQGSTGHCWPQDACLGLSLALPLLTAHSGRGFSAVPGTARRQRFQSVDTESKAPPGSSSPQRAGAAHPLHAWPLPAHIYVSAMLAGGATCCCCFHSAPRMSWGSSQEAGRAAAALPSGQDSCAERGYLVQLQMLPSRVPESSATVQLGKSGTTSPYPVTSVHVRQHLQTPTQVSHAELGSHPQGAWPSLFSAQGPELCGLVPDHQV